ncbi:type 4 pilus major pilin [Comamonas sp. w2-DMI]|uniref:type 4 pilus major pilin n=1 Tax=Comamonas sp. w2-DMI TaxID=3126391 RepID=UPI0032E416DF
MKMARNTQKMFSSSRRNQGGWSIVQVMFGLLVAGMFLYVAVSQYQDSTKKARIEAATQEFIQMVGTAQKTYGYANLYGQVTTAIAVQGGIVPEHRRNTGANTANNNYNGAITFAPATINTANDGLSITFANVKGTDCQQLVQNTESITRQVFVGATQVKPTDAAVNLASLSSTCDATATVDVRWVIGRG